MKKRKSRTQRNPRKKHASGMYSLRERLFDPVDIASIAIFRIMFGAIIFWDVWWHFKRGLIQKYYVAPEFHFKYFGFEWIQPWPGNGMYIHFVAVGICALCVMTGLFYRITTWLLLLCIAFWYLQDQATYLNHYYLTTLLAFQLAVIPAHHSKSFDAYLKPELTSDTIPAWCLWLLRAQVGILYFYGGIAKLNSDWLRGEPVRYWLNERKDYHLIGGLLDTEAAVMFMSYGGLLFDLAIAPALLWRKTRSWAFAACVLFHFSNLCLFNIGIFPFLATAATLLMLPPDWPRKVCLFFSPREGSTPQPTQSLTTSQRNQRLVIAFLVAYLTIQVCLPLRHFLYKGNPSWTQEGHRFAWRMKLDKKEIKFRFIATDPSTGKSWPIEHQDYLTAQQFLKVAADPGMALQFAHFLEGELKKQGHKQIEIRLKTRMSLNGRPFQELIDSSVDLTKEKRTLWHPKWVYQLEEPRRGR